MRAKWYIHHLFHLILTPLGRKSASVDCNENDERLELEGNIDLSKNVLISIASKLPILRSFNLIPFARFELLWSLLVMSIGFGWIEDGRMDGLWLFLYAKGNRMVYRMYQSVFFSLVTIKAFIKPNSVRLDFKLRRDQWKHLCPVHSYARESQNALLLA